MSGKTLHTVNLAFKEEFPNDPIPARQTIYRLSKQVWWKNYREMM